MSFHIHTRPGEGRLQKVSGEYERPHWFDASFHPYIDDDFRQIVSDNAQFLTVACWLRKEIAAGTGYIFTEDLNTPNRRINYTLQSNTGLIRAILWDDGSTITKDYLTTGSISDDAWHHVLIEFDGSHGAGAGEINIYVDGVLDTTPPSTDDSMSQLPAVAGAPVPSMVGGSLPDSTTADSDDFWMRGFFLSESLLSADEKAILFADDGRAAAYVDLLAAFGAFRPTGT